MQLIVEEDFSELLCSGWMFLAQRMWVIAIFTPKQGQNFLHFVIIVPALDRVFFEDKVDDDNMTNVTEIHEVLV
jgi:hypothetical protein